LAFLATIFWVVTPQLIETNILEEHASSIFRVKGWGGRKVITESKEFAAGGGGNQIRPIGNSLFIYIFI
jgi:hypothetical protein